MSFMSITGAVDMWPFHLAIRTQLAALTLLLATGCATNLSESSKNQREGWSVVQPFHHALAGMGGGAIVGSIAIPERRETEIASQSLVLALQDQQLSVKHPELAIDGVIPSGVKWTTDIAPIPSDAVSTYNQRFPSLALRPALYGILYEGVHDTSQSEFRYKISARLHERGVLSGWTPVSDDRYFGQFFVQRLADAIKVALKAVSVSKK
jgi:hypothetical protein